MAGVCLVERSLTQVKFLILINGEEIKCRTKKLAEELAVLSKAQVIERHSYRLWRPGQGLVKNETYDIVYTPSVTLISILNLTEHDS